MRPCAYPPLRIRGLEFGGPKPLFCIPLVAKDLDHLIAQAQVARTLDADIVEWRVDSYQELNPEGVFQAARQLRSALPHESLLFTLRIKKEGGKAELSQESRAHCIDTILRSELIDLVDLEMCNGEAFLDPLMKTAHDHGARVILSFHDFEATPSNEILLGTIAAMLRQCADIAKVACMPRERGDVLRLLEVTLAARSMFPALPLCTMSMGELGSLSRVAGFLYGSDMAFAVGQEISAPGQIPIREAKAIAESLLRHA